MVVVKIIYYVDGCFDSIETTHITEFSVDECAKLAIKALELLEDGEEWQEGSFIGLMDFFDVTEEDDVIVLDVIDSYSLVVFFKVP